ncbi:MAG: hypothetical protein J3R72DRAFT_488802 [Linnemannia gamsii]|nr:MAG: hypothetical protein J3R72DRAFT_488802 [Linnemannia gamsii]
MTLSVLPLEILHLIGSYLLPVDLLQCVIVSREWNTVFIPLLWHTIDSDRSTWRKILHEYDSEHVRGHKDEQWIQALFNKYAHHIRCLKVYDRDIFCFVGQSGTCTRLESLEMFELHGSYTLKELADKQHNIDYGVGASSVDECEESGFKDGVLSPFLSKLNSESGLNLKILSSLKSLVTMEDPWPKQSLAAILESVPIARHLRVDKVELEPALESVHMKKNEYFVEELDDWVDPIEEPFGFEEARAVLGGVHSRLERLDLGYGFRHSEVEQFLPLFPTLKPIDE